MMSGRRCPVLQLAHRLVYGIRIVGGTGGVAKEWIPGHKQLLLFGQEYPSSLSDLPFRCGWCARSEPSHRGGTGRHTQYRKANQIDRLLETLATHAQHQLRTAALIV